VSQDHGRSGAIDPSPAVAFDFAFLILEKSVGKRDRPSGPWRRSKSRSRHAGHQPLLWSPVAAWSDGLPTRGGVELMTPRLIALHRFLNMRALLDLEIVVPESFG
jgi:hypothetical protein